MEAWHCACIPADYADGHLVANYGVHELTDDTGAQIAAIELARTVGLEIYKVGRQAGAAAAPQAAAQAPPADTGALRAQYEQNTLPNL